MSVDPELWHACAGRMIQMPLPDSNVYYFPQGHAEHTYTNVDFGNIPRVSCILCKVIDVKFMADLELEEVYAKIMLSPLESDDRTLVDTCTDKLAYLAKTLSHTEAGHGGLSVPRDKAEAIFPKLDYSKDTSSQTVIAKDMHGEIWEFKHVARGTPKRHMLTTGWNGFVNRKNLVEENTVVFTLAETGDLCVGIMHAKGRRGLKPEDVVKAASLAVNGQQFEITYYPRASSPEFVVKASSVNAATRVKWRVGMRLLMAYETKGSLQKSRFMGTLCSVEDADPLLWPKSPWRCLQVIWDEDQDRSQNKKRVSPWLVELPPNTSTSRIPAVDLNPTHKFELDLLPKHFDESNPPKNENPDNLIHGNTDLTIGSSSSNLKGNNDKPNILLFGKQIHTDQQVNHSSGKNGKEIDGMISSDQCQIFLESEDVCRGTLDLSVTGSYEKVEKTLADWFRFINFGDDSTCVTYKDSEGVVKRMGDEPYSKFVLKAKRLTVLRGVFGHDEYD